jgi:hypothetical protein
MDFVGARGFTAGHQQQSRGSEKKRASKRHAKSSADLDAEIGRSLLYHCFDGKEQSAQL